MTDPYRLLGVPETADDEAIRAAYLAAIRACPPERDRLARALFDTSAATVQEVIEILSADWRPARPGEQRLRRLLGGK